MGRRADATLVYGFDLGRPGEWNLEEANEDGELSLPWYRDGRDEDFEDAATERLLEAAGFSLADRQVDGAERALAWGRTGIRFETYGFGDNPWNVVIATGEGVTAYASEARTVNPGFLQERPYTRNYSATIRAALLALGLTPTREHPDLDRHPGWLLTCSYSE